MDRRIDEQGVLPERSLWLVRHGESTWNALGLVQGQMGEPTLTRRGVAQARRAARQLAGRPVRIVCSSDLQRAVQTAQPIAAALGLDVVQDPRLRERGLGTAEGAPASALLPEHSGIGGGRVVDPDAAPPGGESVRQLCRRVAGFVEQLGDTEDVGDGSPGDVVLVVHGGVVRAVLAHLDAVEPDRMAWGPIGNGLVVQRALPRPARRYPVSVFPAVATEQTSGKEFP